MEKLVAEWIPHRNAYRVYNPNKWQNTVAYVEDEKELAERGVIILDADKSIEL